MSCEKCNCNGEKMVQKHVEKNEETKTNNKFNNVKNSDLLYISNPMIPVITVCDKDEKPLFNLFCKSPHSNPKLIEKDEHIYLVEMDNKNVYVSQYDKKIEKGPLKTKISEKTIKIPEHEDKFPGMNVLRINDIEIEDGKMKINYSRNLKHFSSELELVD